MNRLRNRYIHILKWALLPALLSLGMVIYLPGVGGRFLLDDYSNLQNLDQVQDYGYGAYVFNSGIAGPTGRPLSLVTFALQYKDWPANPAAFKFVNICLHLLIGVLVFVLCRGLGGIVTKDGNRTFMLAFIATVLWLLHPMQVSTTLYAVQRMTQISALFTVLGIIGYLYFRLKLMQGFNRKLLLLQSLAFSACLLLATLGKENGILLPLYILIIEATLLSGAGRQRFQTIWSYFFLAGPLLALVVYLAVNFGSEYASFHSRGYNMGQKVITEGVVLTDYLRNLLLPRLSAFSLYHDDFPVSRGLLSPPSTIISLVILAGLLLLALIKRHDWQVFSFSTLWFLGGHILESSYLNLELYFEHRNYLPSLGLFFLLAWLVIKAAELFARRWVVYTAAAIYCLLVIVQTRLEVDIWSRPGVQAVTWAGWHPRSERALYDLLQFYQVNHDYEEAGAVLTRMERLEPDKIYPSLQRIEIKECQAGIPVAGSQWDGVIMQAKLAKTDGLVSITTLDQFVLNILRGSCPGGDAGRLSSLIRALIDNPGFAGSRAYLYEFLSSLAIHDGDYRHGLELIRRSLEYEFTVSRKITELKLLYQLGEKGQARQGREELLRYIRKDYRLEWGYGRMVRGIRFQ